MRHPVWGPKPQPRHVPWLGIQPAPFALRDDTQAAEPLRTGWLCSFFKITFSLCSSDLIVSITMCLTISNPFLCHLHPAHQVIVLISDTVCFSSTTYTCFFLNRFPSSAENVYLYIYFKCVSLYLREPSSNSCIKASTC